MTTGNGSGANRRVVITGMGVISPVGHGLDETWTNLLAGTSGGGPITSWDATEDFPCRIGCDRKNANLHATLAGTRGGNSRGLKSSFSGIPCGHTHVYLCIRLKDLERCGL